MDFEILSEGENKLTLNISLDIMTPKDLQDTECVVAININFYSKDKISVLATTIRGYVDVDISLNEEEREREIKKYAAPIFYDILRNFISETIEKTNVDFPNIPPMKEIDL